MGFLALEVLSVFTFTYLLRKQMLVRLFDVFA